MARRVAADAVADVDDADKIQSLSCRNMSFGRGGIRSRTLHADDLIATVAPLTLSRQVLTSYKTSQGGAARTMRPSTAHISKSSPRATLRDFVSWFAAEVDLIHANAAKAAVNKSQFLRSFAQPIKRADLPVGVQPTAVFLDLSKLEQGIVEEDLAVFLKDKRSGATLIQVPDEFALGAIHLFGDPGTVDPHPINATNATVSFEGVASKLVLHMNKQSYSISYPDLRNVRIGDRTGKDLRTFTEWVRDPESEALFVSMNDIRFAFSQGSLVRDEQIRAQAPLLLTCLHPIQALSTCASEKGEAALVPQSTTFSADSVFGTIENVIAKESILVCDDLGDEWADYVGIDEQTKTITLYHAKHGSPTTSASAFQVVVGQALKNLGRVGVLRDNLEGKKHGWGETYRAENITTLIKRIRRGGTVDDVVRAYEQVAALPARRARVAIVASFLSKTEIEDSFARIEKNGTMRRQDPQRVWLISSFVSLCREASAEAIIYCAP
ncbi:MAG: hypothetical protein QM820_36425 [Minicystis sp.]